MTADDRSGLRARTGLLLAIALIALGATLFADVTIAEWGQSSGTEGAPERFLSDRVVNVERIQAPPGSIVRLFPSVPADGPYERYEFYAVENGQGAAILEGRAAQHVYATRSEVAADIDHGCCPLEFKRPMPPDGVDGTWLDLVWVLHYDEESTPPDSAEGREYFERWLKAEGLGATARVTSGGAAAFHTFVAMPLLIGLSVASAGLAIVWIHDVLRGGRRVAREEEAASGVALVELGGRSLVFLRGVLLGVALPLAYVIWITGFFFLDEIATTPGFGGAGGTVMEVALLVGLIVLAAAWAAATLRVQRSHRRWRAMMDEQPLAL